MSKHAFQSTFTLDTRREFAERCCAEHPGKFPLYVYVHPSYRKLLQMRNNKYVVAGDCSLGEFKQMLFKNMQLPKEATYTLLLFVSQGQMPPVSTPIMELYEQHKDSDGILYMEVIGETTFGSLI